MDVIRDTLARADITLNGTSDCDVIVQPQHQDALVKRLLAEPNNLGFGEAYMDGLWTTKDLVGLFVKLIRAKTSSQSRKSFISVLSAVWRAWILISARLECFWGWVSFGLFGWRRGSSNNNKQSIQRSLQNMDVHYNLGNDFYARMLDPWMQYSCAFFPAGCGDCTSLSDAQLHKLEMIAHKLNLKPGMTVLDIGCGFGALSHFLASKFEVRVVGITLSRAQQSHALEHFAHQDVTILLRDYRHLTLRDLPSMKPVDRIVSVGMFEHVGPSNYATFFQVCEKLLDPVHGLLLLHTIGAQDPVADERDQDPWIHKYIFPDSHLPGLDEMVVAARQHFIVEDVHNFGLSYASTLKSWRVKLAPLWRTEEDTDYKESKNEAQTDAVRLPMLANLRFKRMWEYYLASSTAMFVTREANLYQMLCSPLAGALTSKQADWTRGVAPPRDPHARVWCKDH